MRRSFLAQLAREREERERKKREEKVPPTVVPVKAPPRSELAQLAQERERRERAKREKQQKGELAEDPRLKARREAISDINTHITPLIENSMDVMESEALRFAAAADERNITHMVSALETVESELFTLKDSVDEFNDILDRVFAETGRAEDKGWVLRDTFHPNEIARRIRENLDLLRGTAEATLVIDLSIPGIRQPIRTLNRIFALGNQEFNYPPTEIEVEMDVSRDEEIAKRLATSLRGLRGPTRFEPIIRPSERILSPTRRELATTRRGSRNLSLEAAQKIVEAHEDVDVPTLREILKAQGFASDVIRSALARKEPVPLLPPRPRRRRLPASFFRPIEEPSARKRVMEPSAVDLPPVDLTPLSTKELVDIAKAHGLTEYPRKRKTTLIRYLQENLDRATLLMESRKRGERIRFTELPVIRPSS